MATILAAYEVYMYAVHILHGKRAIEPSNAHSAVMALVVVGDVKWGSFRLPWLAVLYEVGPRSGQG